MTLHEECLEALGSKNEVLTEDETRNVFNSFTTSFPITKWGVVDWTAVENRFMVCNVDDISYLIENHRPNAAKHVCILWSDNSLPSVSVDLDKALRAIDDVTAVSFDTWIYNENDSYVIEFHHEGRITIAFV